MEITEGDFARWPLPVCPGSGIQWDRLEVAARNVDVMPALHAPSCSSAGVVHSGSRTSMMFGTAAPMPRIIGRYMSSIIGVGTLYVPGLTARTM